MTSKEKAKHIWQEFLEARANCIDWLMTNPRHTYDTVANVLSMDAVQVELIHKRCEDNIA